MVLERLSVVSRPVTIADSPVEADSMKCICQERGISEKQNIFQNKHLPNISLDFLANSKLQII